ncbi:hypothetical protein GIV46_19205, partial [Pseudomonas poae]|nr:hypothetical protein [Pseudomonas poae]
MPATVFSGSIPTRLTRLESPMSDRLTLLRPDDWHIHLRDGAALPHT